MNTQQLGKIEELKFNTKSEPHFTSLFSDSAECVEGKIRFNYVVSATFESAADSISPAKLVTKNQMLKIELANSIRQIISECKHKY